MGTVTRIDRAKFSIGELVHHRLFEYRGVVADVNSTFQLTDEWYDAMARSRPPKDQPWYHVLVHGSTQTTYVAERNLQADSSARPISHPMISHYFSGFTDGHYVSDSRSN
jgi:heat shock protein HspQ